MKFGRVAALVTLMTIGGGLNGFATDYVFLDGDGYYLAVNSNGQLDHTNTFSPSCIWTCSSDNKDNPTITSLKNNSDNYLFTTANNKRYWLRNMQNDGGDIRVSTKKNDASKTWRKDNNNRLLSNTYYYLYYRGGWKGSYTNTYYTSGRDDLRATLYEITSASYTPASSTEFTTVPSVSPSAVTLNYNDQQQFTTSAAATTTSYAACTKYTYNNTNIYYYNNTAYTSEDAYKNAAKTNTTASITYTWALSGTGATYLSKSDNNTNTTVTYSTLNSTGANQTATLTVTAKAGSVQKTATATLTVTSKLPSTLSFNNSNLGVNSTTSFQLPGTTLTDGNTPITGTVTFSSSNTGVATVSNDGKLTIVAAGNTTITANFAGNSTYGPSSAQLAITVTNVPKVDEESATDMSITPAAQTIDVNGNQTFSASASINATTRKRDPFFRVSAGGNTVYKQGTTYSASEPEIDVQEGTPINLTNVSWSFTGNESSYVQFDGNNTNLTTNTISVSRTSNLTATQKTVTLNATAAYGTFNKSATATITIPMSYEDLSSISCSDLTIDFGSTGTLVPTTNIAGQGAKYVNLTYTSANEAIATVDATGKVTGIAAGSTTITIQSKKQNGTNGPSCQVTVTVNKLNLLAPTISADNDGYITITDNNNPSLSAKIYYTTNGATPTTSSTLYTTTFGPVDDHTVVKAIAAKDNNYNNSSVAEKEYIHCKLPTPTILVTSGGITFSDAEEVEFHYTTNGSTPTSSSTKWDGQPIKGVANGATIKVIATSDDCGDSDVATATNVASGVSETTVVFMDYEDHNWTYYNAKPDNDYPDPLRSPDPRNVKITYLGNGHRDDANQTAVTGVQVSASETANTFVYYKTIEKKAWGNGEGRWLTGDYAYIVIPNPFSKRPKVGTQYYGFKGWMIKSGGQYISGKNNGDLLALEEKINFTGLPAGNVTSAEVVFEAVWTAATVKSGSSSQTFTGGTYETNFWVVTGNSSVTVSAPSAPVTVMGCYPDGTATGDNPIIGSATSGASVANILKIENIRIGNGETSVHPYEPNMAGMDASTGSGTFTIGYAPLIVGRGCVGTVNRVRSSASGGQYTLRLESGKYYEVRPMYNNASTSANDNNWGRIVFGCDYDRVADDGHANNGTGDNSKLRILDYYSWTDNGACKANATTNSEWMDITVKSGYYGYCHNKALFNGGSGPDGRGLCIGGNADQGVNLVLKDVDGSDWSMTNADMKRSTVNNSFYCGGTHSFSNRSGVIRVLIEGGEFNSINGGGYGNGATDNGTCIGPNFRVKGGWIKGALYGTASSTQSTANTRIVVTGGEINGWIAGGCNGTDFQNWGSNAHGYNTGSTYLYIGGAAECRSHNKDGVYNNAWGMIGDVPGGNIFASGRGISPTAFGAATTSDNYKNYSYCGSTTNSYLVVADECQVEQAVYGGGYLGIAQNSHIWITGGTIGNVYGGASAPITANTGDWRAKTTDIRMYGGNVLHGVYGGHYQGTGNAGAIHTSTSVAINGGKVGTDASNLGYVFGGGYGEGTNVNGNVDVIIGKQNATEGALIHGDVYGGGSLGNVNGTTVNTSLHTNVTLYSGYVNGGVYGGALGDATHAAAVYGKVNVNVNGGAADYVYGCNNVNGTPKDDVTVIVEKTSPITTGSRNYHILGVYGGGNESAYDPVSPNNHSTHVWVKNCNNSIQEVYGGGNAASSPATHVEIEGGYIDYVFGGGNGIRGPQYSAHVGYYKKNDGSTGETYGTGIAQTEVTGGVINHVFGGSNMNGNIRQTAVSVFDDGESCDFEIGEVYGAGNEAYMDGAIDMRLGCIPGFDVLFGGAKKADIGQDINLTLTSGTFGTVFGGNNLGGSVNGSITVTLDEVGCKDLIVGTVYGGGNMASYSAPTTGKYAGKNYPVINVISATSIDTIYGGGKGEDGVVIGNPTVNVNMIYGYPDSGQKDFIGPIKQIYGGGNAADVQGDTYVNIGTAASTSTHTKAGKTTSSTSNSANITGNVYGGGNEANVTGQTHVTIGK